MRAWKSTGRRLSGSVSEPSLNSVPLVDVGDAGHGQLDQFGGQRVGRSIRFELVHEVRQGGGYLRDVEYGVDGGSNLRSNSWLGGSVQLVELPASRAAFKA